MLVGRLCDLPLYLAARLVIRDSPAVARLADEDRHAAFLRDSGKGEGPAIHLNVQARLMAVPAEFLDEKRFEIEVGKEFSYPDDVERHWLFSSLRGGEAHRADDARLPRLGLLALHGKRVGVSQGHDLLRQVLVRGVRPKQAVQGVLGRLAERVAVDFLDGAMQFLAVEKRVLDLLGVLLEALVGAEPRP